MNKKITVGIAVAFIFIAVALTFTATMIYAMNLFDQKIINVQERAVVYDKISEIDTAVRQRFYRSIEDNEVIRGLASGYLTGLNDPYARYMSRGEILTMEEEESGQVNSLGLRLQESASGYPVVSFVYPDSSAAKVGMEVGDILIKVEGEDTLVLGFPMVQSRMYGAEGNQIALTYTREGTEYNVDVVYAPTEVVTVTSTVLNDEICYVRISGYNDLTLSQFDHAVKEASENSAIRAFVFDVRGVDTGTNLKILADILDELVFQGTTVSGVYSGEITKVLYTSDPDYLNYPVAVLVDERTQGLSELFAAVLSEQENVRVVGQTTFGKGTYQELITLSDGSGIYISVCKLLACGVLDYDGVGVMPDFVVASEEGFVLDGDNPNFLTDLQLRRALDVLQSDFLGG